MKYLFFSLRPRQWIKNIFVFLPLIFGKKLFIFSAALNSILAFFIFCITASAVYIINDLIDIEKDKKHPLKRLRPLASGKITVRHAAILSFILSLAGIVFSFSLDVNFGWVIISYLFFNLLYTKFLKKAVIIDVFSLSVFFLLRIVGGCVIAKVIISYWIIIMSSLLTSFLGFNKRRQELLMLGKRSYHAREVLIKYNLYFIDQIIAVITSSVVIVYMLYSIDQRTIKEFGTYHLIYTTPFVYYGIFRYLYLTRRFYKDGDPTRIFLSDDKTILNLGLWIIACIVIIYFGV
jgi:4-hydroxybenzoate polyprenyltransferase